jgi:hypothetical protein
MNNPEEISKGMKPNLPLWSYQLQQNSKLAVKTRKDLEIHLITRALKDEGFKQEFLANPKAVVEQELGTKLPEELEINVLKETENTFYMVLPYNPYEGISEEELKSSLGMTYEDIAQWVLDQQRNALLDEKSSVSLMSQVWKDEIFKQEFLHSPMMVIEQKLGKEFREEFRGITIQVVVETINTIFMVLPQVWQPPIIPIESAEAHMLMIALGTPLAGGTDQITPASKCTTNAVCCGECRFFSIIYV